MFEIKTAYGLVKILDFQCFETNFSATTDNWSALNRMLLEDVRRSLVPIAWKKLPCKFLGEAEVRTKIEGPLPLVTCIGRVLAGDWHLSPRVSTALWFQEQPFAPIPHAILNEMVNFEWASFGIEERLFG